MDIIGIEVVLLLAPVVAFLLCYAYTQSLSSSLALAMPFMIICLTYVFIGPLFFDAVEQEELETLDMSEIMFAVHSGELLETDNMTMHLIPFENSSFTHIAINWTEFLPVPQHFKYNATEEEYILQDTNITSLCSFNIYHNTSTYTMNYSEELFINASVIPDFFPVVENASFNFTISLITPAFDNGSSLFVFSDRIAGVSYGNLTEPVNESIFDTLFGEDNPYEEYFLYFVIGIFLPINLLLVYKMYTYRQSALLARKRRLLFERALDATDLKNKLEEEQKDYVESKYGKIKKERGDYSLLLLTTADKALELAKEYREKNHWTKIINYAKKMSDNFDAKRCCAVYISNWSMDDTDEKGHPKWK